MKKIFHKKGINKYRNISEDLRLIRSHISKQSLRRISKYGANRHPKHVKNYMDYIEIT